MEEEISQLVVRNIPSSCKQYVCQMCRMKLSVLKELETDLLSYVSFFYRNKSYICRVFATDSSSQEHFQYSSDVFKSSSRSTISLKCLKTSTAKSVDLNVIVSDINKVGQFKYYANSENSKLQEMCASLLYNVCVAEDYTVNTEDTELGRLYGISYISINHCDSIGEDQGIDAVVVNRKTTFVINKVISKDRFEHENSQSSHKSNILGGLSNISRDLIELMKVSFYLRHLNYSVKPSKGILLRGPPGTGKTSLVKHVSTECCAYLVTVNGPEVFGSRPGETEENIQEIFTKTLLYCQEGPCVLFIDEIDALCRKHKAGDGFQERRTTLQIVKFLDRIHEDDIPLVVLAATNRPAQLDPILRRPGRFDKEIMIPVPTHHQRQEILAVHTVTLPVVDSLDLCTLADVTNGYVGADLAALCHEAAYLAMAESRQGTQKVVLVSMTHFLQAARQVQPSSQKGNESVVDSAPVYWNNIGGLEQIKLQIKQVVEWPIQHPEAFHRMGLPCPRGVLLYGPPGCCKTTLVRAAATSSNATFLSLSGAQLYSPYVGDSERMISEIFQRARAGAPSIIFLDEIDSIIGKRSEGGSQRSVQERVLSALLNEMDGIGIRLDDKITENHERTAQKLLEGQHDTCSDETRDSTAANHCDNRNVLLVAATNRPDLLDEALMRPGRIDRVLYVPPPDLEARLQILKIYTVNMPCDEVDLEDIAIETEYYTGADLENLCREAALIALSADIQTVCVKMEHFTSALKYVKPSLTAEIEEKSSNLVSKWNGLPK